MYEFSSEASLTSRNYNSLNLSKGRFAFICIILVLVGFGFGFLGGYYTNDSDDNTNDVLNTLTREEDDSISAKLLQEVDAGNIKQYLSELTAHPHLAGTEADLQQAEDLKSFWLNEAGLDRVQLYPFDVLLSYPNMSDLNRIVMKDANDQILFTTQLYEEILRPEQNQSDVVPPFNAFSAAGQPQGDLFYVNYGTVDDFIWLNDTYGVDLTGMICIARYGRIFRGDKAAMAQEYGCRGLILYSDPEDYTPDNYQEVYPDSWFLPGTGVQRGNVKKSQGLGDPLTPGYPAIKSAYRLRVDDAGLPKIPVHPIGYDDAQVLLSNMTGDEVMTEWRGKLNITYRYGPGFNNSNWTTQMLITTHTQNVTTYNAMGFIEGEIEPDRYVMLGNHRDAWVFGSLDPSSGTAAMMELSRAFGVMLKNGWRPRRTIVFCSWGAEEHGIIGTREFVEYYDKILSERAVTYINVDIAVQGNYSLRVKTMPLLHQLMFDAAKQIPNPNPAEVDAGRETLYDTWFHTTPELDDDGLPTPGVPEIELMGSGSDFAPFVSKSGITSIDLRYDYDPYWGVSSYPMYHTVYETFHLVETYYDPDFTYHKAIAQYWGELARRLADSYVLPFDVNQYATSLDGYVQDIIENYGELMNNTNTDAGLDDLHQAIADFKEASDVFTGKLDVADRNNPVEIRMYNDMMMQIDRMFIDSHGLPGRPLLRNVVFAPSQHDSYSGATFPGLTDSLYELGRAKTEQEVAEKSEGVKQQLAVITYFIDAAASSIENVLI